MGTQRGTMDSLLERELRQPSAARGDCLGPTAPPSRLNAVWRQKVIQWYFTLVEALRRQQGAAPEPPSSSDGGGSSLFDRSAVYASANLLDTYLMSLPPERAIRYKHDRPAYQLLATTCLLLGMRLAQHDREKQSRPRAVDEGQQCGLKRAKARMMNMNEASASEDGDASAKTTGPADSPRPGAAIPNATTILRISAAPKSITEQHVLSMVREMTGSRSFPRSRVVTVLDFIRALGSQGGSEDSPGLSLSPDEVEEASRLADALLRDASFLSARPSVMACAAVTLALARSRGRGRDDVAPVRAMVYQSIFGRTNDDPALQVAVCRAESAIHVRVPSSRGAVRPVVAVPTTHLIPLEDE